MESMDALLAPERGAQVVVDLQARFDRLDVAYKIVNNTPIEAAILVPRTIASGTETKTAPVLAHFHGGGLLMGTNPEPLLPLRLGAGPRLLHARHLGLPRLPPDPRSQSNRDARRHRQLLDLAAPPSPIRYPLPLATPHPGPRPRRHRGRERGRLPRAADRLPLQRHRPRPRPRHHRPVPGHLPGPADLAAYNTSRPGEAPPDRDPNLDTVIDNYLKTMPPGAVRTCRRPGPGEPSSSGPSITQSAAKRRVLGPDPDGRLTLPSALQAQAQAPAQQQQPIWVIQGSEDSIVARAATDEVVAWLREARPDAVVRYTVRPGEHGFDGLNKPEDDWVAEGLAFVKGYWL